MDEPDDVLPVLDEPPKSGTYVDHDQLELDDDDIAAGNLLGDTIDIDDDDDNGLDRL